MIVERKNINLFGKLLFTKMVAIPPFKLAFPMQEEACFLHVRNGLVFNFSEEQMMKVKNQQSVLMKCGNYLSQAKPISGAKNLEAIAVHFHPDVLKKIYENDIPGFLKSDKQQTTTDMVKINASVLVNKYIEDIAFYFDHPQLVNDEILILKLKEIILLLAQSESSESIRTILKNLFTKRTSTFKSIIESHLFADLTTEDLANLTNLSLSSFKRQFKIHYQTSPSSYIQHRRLEKAKTLLSISDSSISEIAFNCGFKSVSHFSKKFKQVYGETPSDLRLSLPEK